MVNTGASQAARGSVHLPLEKVKVTAANASQR
jgi:hypothetical protein